MDFSLDDTIAAIATAPGGAARGTPQPGPPLRACPRSPEGPTLWPPGPGPRLSTYFLPTEKQPPADAEDWNGRAAKLQFLER